MHPSRNREAPACVWVTTHASPEARMKLPIDTSNTMIVAGTVEPVIDFDTKRQRADQNGEPLWSVELVSFCEGGTQVWSTRVVGKAPGLVPGQPLKVRGLVAR